MYWYYKDHDQKIGPFTRRQIFELIARKDLSDKDYVWHPGFKEWLSVATVVGLVSVPAGADAFPSL